MAMREIHSLDGMTRVAAKLLIIAAVLGCLAGAVCVVALTPVIVASIYDSQDLAKLANIGETYGAATAILSATALVVVCASLLVQHRQFKIMLKSIQRERIRETVKIAMDNPQYAQCWGARVAPQHVDERLFYYANFLVLNWYDAWEDGLLDA